MNLPDQPAECRDKMERVIPKEGEKARWVQKRWEIVADNEDRRDARCIAFSDDLRKGLAGQ